MLEGCKHKMEHYRKTKLNTNNGPKKNGTSRNRFQCWHFCKSSWI